MTKLTEKQRTIIEFIKHNGEITTKQANDMFKSCYYHNHEHYVAEILTRLVKSGTIQRRERGVYIMRNVPIEPVDKNQISLF